MKLKREDAAKFSFYLSAPVVLGATILSLKDSMSVIVANLPMFITGILVSFITGIFCIRFLMKYLKKHDFKRYKYSKYYDKNTNFVKISS